MSLYDEYFDYFDLELSDFNKEILLRKENAEIKMVVDDFKNLELSVFCDKYSNYTTKNFYLKNLIMSAQSCNMSVIFLEMK